MSSALFRRKASFFLPANLRMWMMLMYDPFSVKYQTDSLLNRGKYPYSNSIISHIPKNVKIAILGRGN